MEPIDVAVPIMGAGVAGLTPWMRPSPLGAELGQRYTSRAVVGDGSPETEPARDPVLHHTPSTRPGHLIPPARLAIGDREVSTLDARADDRFTRVTGASGRAWLDVAARVSAEVGVEIGGVPISLGLETNDVYGDWLERREVGDGGCVLVRPDRIVAWRSAGPVDDPESALQGVMSSILAGGGEA